MENRKEKVKKSHKMDAFQIGLYVIVALYCLSMLYVLFFGCINSLKDATDYEWNNPFAFLFINLRKAHLEGIFFFLLIDIVLKLLLCYQKSFFSFDGESGK